MTVGWRSLSRRVAVGACLLVLASTSVPLVSAGDAGAAGTRYWSRCGSDNHSQAGWSDAIAHGTSCQQARRLARRWWHQNSTWGFTCEVPSHSRSAGRVVCRRERDGSVQKVRFSYAT